MSKQLYEVVFVQLPSAESQLQDQVPTIIPYVKHEDEEVQVMQQPVTWQECKKQVRSFYLSQIAKLRATSEKDVS